MSPFEAAELTIEKACRLIRTRQVSPVELTRACLERVERYDHRLRAFIGVLADEARDQARAAEQAVMRGEPLGSLHGIPLALKDTFATRGVRTTCGSKVLRDFVPAYDGAVAERLREAGAIFLGTLNMHEFAFGATTTNLHYGATRNPWDENRIPGGSSGGSGAAVAAALCMGSIGTDTGGSVRLPASLCGIVGLKPTRGRISNLGTLPLSLTMDHSGPMTRSVTDAALLLQVLAGPDSRDHDSSRRKPPSYSRTLRGKIKGTIIGIPREYFAESMDPEVRAAVSAALDAMTNMGASIEEVSLPHSRYAPAAFVALVLSEASIVHNHQFKRSAGDYGVEVRNLLYAGSLVPARRYIQAQRIRALITQDLAAALRRVDAIVLPTTPMPAPLVGQRSVTLGEKSVDITAALSRFTLPFNLAGLPAISIPCGFTAAGLPIGLQIGAAAFAETTILRLAFAYESHHPWWQRRPPGFI